MLTGNPVGQVIDDRYEILAVLGSGGMGSVYKARLMTLDRTVALKLLHFTHLTDTESRVRFEREGQVLADLSHPHIIVFYHFGVYQKLYPYIAMEHLHGQSLRSLLNAEVCLSWQRAIDIGIQVCDAMQYAHERHIVHRDLKPENIFLQPEPKSDYVKIFDFGLAKALPEDGMSRQKLTQTGTLIGSIHYLSPEQCQGKAADYRSDIYSLGCLLYEAIAGEPPLTADNPVGLLYKHTNEYPKSFAELNLSDKIPEALETVLFKSMAKQPESRYQSMSELQADLVKIEQGRGGEIKIAKKPGEANRIVPGKSNKKVILLMLFFLSLVGLLTGIYFYEPLLASLAVFAAAIGKDPKEVVKTEIKAGDLLVRVGRLNAALMLYSQANQALGTDKPLSKAQALEKIAAVYKKQGFLDRSKAFCILAFMQLNNEILIDSVHNKQALNTEDKRLLLSLLSMLGSTSPTLTVEIQEVFRLLVGSCEAHHDWQSAFLVRKFQESLILRTYGKNSWAYRDYLIKEGGFLARHNQPDAASKLFKEVLHSTQQNDGATGLLMGQAEKEIGDVYYSLDNLGEANKHWQAAIDIFYHLKQEGLADKRALISLTEIYFAKNNPEEALKCLPLVLASAQAFEGLEDKKFTEACSHLNEYLKNELHKDAEAAQLANVAVSWYEAKLPKEKLSENRAYFALLRMQADNAKDIHKFQEADSSYEKALQVFEKTDENSYFEFQHALFERACCQISLGNFARAQEFTKKQLSLIERFKPEDKIAQMNIFWTLGELNFKMKRTREQIAMYKNAESIAAELPGMEFQRSWHLIHLINPYLELNDQAAADLTFDKALALQSATNPPDLDLLVQICDLGRNVYWNQRNYKKCLFIAQKEIKALSSENSKYAKNFAAAERTARECMDKLGKG